MTLPLKRRRKKIGLRPIHGPRKNKVNVNVSEKYKSKKYYYIYKGCAALSLDKKMLFKLDTNYEGEFVVPEGVEYIDQDAFKDCDELTGVYFPSTIKRVYFNPFTYCDLDFIYYSSLPDTLEDLDIRVRNKVVYVPYEDIGFCSKLLTYYRYNGYLLCSNSSKLLYNHADLSYIGDKDTKVDDFGVTYTLDGKTLVKASKSIDSYTVPEGVKVIAENAFEKTKIKSVILPKSLRLIGASAFKNCSKLTTVQLNNGIKRIGSSAFQNCRSLSSFKMPNSVEDIGFGVFEGCSSLSEIKLSDNLQLIPSASFSNTQIKTIRLPDKTVFIGDEAFEGCQSLENIVIPDNVKYVWDSCFRLCSSLKSISIPSHVVKFGEAVFEGCSSLQTVSFFNELEIVPNYFFSECSSLEKIKLPNSVVQICDYAFSGCINLKEVSLPSSLRSIGSSAFAHCISITTMDLTNIEYISYGVFWKCSSLKTIELSKSLHWIDYGAFYGCDSLKSISIYNPDCEIIRVQSCFSGLEALFVPKESIDNYKSKYLEIQDIIKPLPFEEPKVIEIKPDNKPDDMFIPKIVNYKKLIGTQKSDSYSDYLDYCYDTQTVNSDECSDEFYDWIYEAAKTEYVSFFEKLGSCKANKGFYIITFNQYRNPKCITGCVNKVFDNLVDAIKAALDTSIHFRNNDIYFKYGKIEITGYRSTGIRLLVIHQLSDMGLKWLTDNDPNLDWNQYIHNDAAFKLIELDDLLC